MNTLHVKIWWPLNFLEVIIQVFHQNCTSIKSFKNKVQNKSKRQATQYWTIGYVNKQDRQINIAR